MEKICDRIYIDNSRRILIKVDEQGALLLNNDCNFIKFINSQIESYQVNNYMQKVLSITPNIATKAEFLLSNKCNMGCIYCYSYESRNKNTISFKQAASVIDKLIVNSNIKNLINGRKRRIYLSFHGGGDPSCEFALLQSIVEYAKGETAKNHTELYLEITTNLSQNNDEILKYYLDNRFFIHVSMDGIENVQNYQRPFCDGSKSFSLVEHNICYLANHGAKFSIRFTITDFSIAFSVDSVTYIKKKFPNVLFIKLAPLEITEQSYKHIINPPKIEDFINVLEEVALLPWNDESEYLSVFGETDFLSNCGMCASARFEQMIISPEGIITTCHEDPLSNDFSYGKVSKEGIIEIDNDKVKLLKKNQCETIQTGKCADCAFRSLCMGGCKHRMSAPNGEMFCAIQKHTLSKHIKRAFDKKSINDIGAEYKRIQYSTAERKSIIEIILLRSV